MRSKTIRLLWIAALVVFVGYLYCPTSTSVLPGLLDPNTMNGAAELGWALQFSTAKSIIESWMMMPELPRWRGVTGVWDSLLRDVSLLLGAIALSQLPLLCSPLIPVRRWVCLALALLFFQCAASVVWHRLDALRYNSSGQNFIVPRQTRFGAWLPPIAFTLAGTALLLRRKDAAL